MNYVTMDIPVDQPNHGLTPFDLGEICISPRAVAALADSLEHPVAFLIRHAGGDWGLISDGQRWRNVVALASGGRVLSAYALQNGAVIGIVTEADRSATALLMAE